MKGGKKTGLMAKAGTQSVLASLISIIIGLAAGALVIIAVGLSDSTLGGQSIWDGIRLVFMGLFSTGRDAAGALTFGFNPASVGNMLFRATPLILTGLSVAVAFKTGLFNIGAPGQYLVHRAWHTHAQRAGLADMDAGVFRRHGGGRAVGHDTGSAQGFLQYK